MSRRLPSLTALRAFEAAARHLSFVRAAAELHVTPAAISQQVRGLEEHLGLPLFRRRARGLVLTDAGASYLPGVSEGFDRLAHATEHLQGADLKGRLSISVLPSFGVAWLAQRLPDFWSRYPEIDLHVDASPDLIDFADGAYDLAVRYGHGRYPGLRATLLMTENVYPVCSPTLLHGPNALRRPRDLRHHTLLHDFGDRHDEPGLSWRSWLRELGVPAIDPTAGPKFADSTAMLRTVETGAGVMIGRSALVDDLLLSGRLVRPFPVSRPADFAYYMVVPEATADVPKIAAMRDWLRDAVQAGAGDDES